MFATVDALCQGQYFWKALTGAWPMPFSMDATDSAVLIAENGELALSVVRMERPDGVLRVVMEIQDTLSHDALLTVTLTSDLIYLNGAMQEVNLDEVGAADAVQFFIPMIRGEWTQESLTEDVNEDRV